MNRPAQYYPAGALSALLAAGSAPANAAGCHLGAPGNSTQHIVYLQFDNVHLRRDNPNVPSDLEQMPNLLHFLEQQGTLLTNHHTPLISHTSVDILTSLTGVYGEQMGMPIGNTILYFSGGSSKYTSSFAYWTDNLGTTSVPQMVDQRGKIHPAPWVPFTRAGCDVGAFSVANIEFENTTSDVDNVFGPTSPEHSENVANHDLAVADFEGIVVHCAKGSTLCGGSAHAATDKLPDEPGSYNGFQALYGNKYVAPALNHSSSIIIKDFDGVAISDGPGGTGNPFQASIPRRRRRWAICRRCSRRACQLFTAILKPPTTKITLIFLPIRTVPLAPVRRIMSCSSKDLTRPSVSSSGNYPVDKSTHMM